MMRCAQIELMLCRRLYDKDLRSVKASILLEEAWKALVSVRDDA